MNRMLQIATAHRRRAYNQFTVRNRRGYAFVDLGAGQQLSGPNGGPRLAEGHFIRVHYAQVLKAEVADGSCDSANIKRVSRTNQDHDQTICFV